MVRYFMSDEDKKALIGKTIQSVSYHAGTLVIEFTDNAALHIDSNANAHDDSGLEHWLEFDVFEGR